jgi:multidrug resistance protein, MATE family
MTLVTPKPYPSGSFRELFYIAAPLIVTNASFMIMRFADQLMISWFDQDAMAAAGSGGVLSFTFLALFMGTCGYVNTFVAQFHGANRPIRITIYLWQGVYLALFSAPLMIALIPLGPVLFHAFGHEADLIQLETIYYSILMIGGPIAALNMTLSSFFNGQERARITMWVNIIGNAANIGLDIVLIYGIGPIPALGLAGAAWATVIATGLIAVIFFCIFLNKRYRKSHQTHRFIKLRAKEFFRLIKFGIPAGFQWFSDMIAFTIFVLIIGSLGKVELFVSNVAFAINHLAFMPVVGLGRAASILVGKYIGKKQLDHSVKSTHNALKLSVVYMVSIAALYAFVPELFLYMFKEPDMPPEEFQAVIESGRMILRMIAVYTLLDAFTIIYMSALQGSGDTKFILVASLILGYVCFLPPLILVVYVFGGGLIEAWFVLAGWIFFYALAFIIRFYQGKWKTINLMGLKTEKSMENPVIG